ncbi:hypothetical protein M2140_000032 [Clostridiales Family XIII bacterium PM5-7]
MRRDDSLQFVTLQDDSVRYVVIPTIVIEADDDNLLISFQWLGFGFGIHFAKVEGEDK